MQLEGCPGVCFHLFPCDLVTQGFLLCMKVRAGQAMFWGEIDTYTHKGMNECVCICLYIPTYDFALSYMPSSYKTEVFVSLCMCKCVRTWLSNLLYPNRWFYQIFVFHTASSVKLQSIPRGQRGLEMPEQQSGGDKSHPWLSRGSLDSLWLISPVIGAGVWQLHPEQIRKLFLLIQQYVRTLSRLGGLPQDWVSDGLGRGEEIQKMWPQ